MESAWGYSWAESWGESWGTPVLDSHGGGDPAAAAEWRQLQYQLLQNLIEQEQIIIAILAAEDI